MEADMALSQLAFKPDEGDERLFVQFYVHPKQNQTKTKEAGRPIFDDTEYIRIVVPGDKDNIIERPVLDSDKQRFRSQYSMFREGKEQLSSGTPLSAWPVVTRAQVEEMAFFGIKTVEQLAEMSDANAQKFLGVNALKQRAKDFLEASKDSGVLTKFRAQIEEKDSQIMTLTNAVEQLKARLDILEKDE